MDGCALEDIGFVIGSKIRIRGQFFTHQKTCLEIPTDFFKHNLDKYSQPEFPFL
jgi:hypothetical protein